MATGRSKRLADYLITAASPVAWLETLALTLLLPLIGYWSDPNDPFFLDTPFPWLILAPVLAALRYGFLYGFISAMLGILLIALAWRLQWLPLADFPAQFSLGMLIIAMLTGEFRDLWQRQLDAQNIINDHQRLRLDEFTRTYHLLKISHDNLEHRIAASTQSLRESLLSLRQRLSVHADAGPQSSSSRTIPTLGIEHGNMTQLRPLLSVADDIMGIFSAFGWVQVAGLYGVDDNAAIVPRPIASLGKPTRLAADDPLLSMAVETGQLVSVATEQDVSANDDDGQTLLAAAPLIDIHGRLWGVIGVQETAFLSFHDANLKLLAVLAGHIGDILTRSAQQSGVDGQEGTDFLHDLERWLLDSRRHALTTLVQSIVFPGDQAHTKEAANLILTQTRGLDRTWRITRNDGALVILMLMPLTNMLEAEAYRRRIENQFQERLGHSLTELGASLHNRELRASDTIDSVLDYLCEVSRLARTRLDQRPGTGA